MTTRPRIFPTRHTAKCWISGRTWLMFQEGSSKLAPFESWEFISTLSSPHGTLHRTRPEGGGVKNGNAALFQTQIQVRYDMPKAIRILGEMLVKVGLGIRKHKYTIMPKKIISGFDYKNRMKFAARKIKECLPCAPRVDLPKRIYIKI